MEKTWEEGASGTWFHLMREQVGRGWLRHDIATGSPSPLPFPTIGSNDPFPSRVRVVALFFFA
eukprot:11483431-Prorocentrum_lima.AAC.1